MPFYEHFFPAKLSENRWQNLCTGHNDSNCKIAKKLAAYLQDLVGKSVSEGPNQYTNLQGIPEARQVNCSVDHYGEACAFFSLP